MRLVSVPWADARELVASAFHEMRAGAWVEVAPRGSQPLVRLERRRGWRKHLLFDAKMINNADVLEEFCSSRGLRHWGKGPRTIRIRVPRRDAVQVAMDLMEAVLADRGIAPGAAVDLNGWGRTSPQAMRTIYETLARDTPIRSGGNLYRRKLSELDDRLERGDD